jgi:hypothetical protein
MKVATTMLIAQEMITMTECITIDYTDEQMPKSEDIVSWFTEQGWSYDADTGILMQGTDKIYINIYKQISAIYFRESNVDFPDDVFAFILSHPGSSVSLATIDDNDYVNMDTAQDFTYDKFVELLNADLEEE